MLNLRGYLFWTPCRVTVVALVAIFILLVINGVTGSSLGLGLQSTSLVTSEVHPLLGTKPKPIRSDEFLVATPLAIGQYNHIPPFPVVNTNLGPDGQNMLVVTMTGVPVKHISALGRPATWGFFAFDLRRALAWYWWFPIFGCLFSLWAVFSNAFKLDWRMGFALSALFTFSPYATAWSFWPAYLVMFPSLALVAVLKLFNTDSLIKASGWAAILCLSLLGFILVLYPAWQVTVGWLFLALFIGLFFGDKLYRQVSWSKATLIGVSILIVLTICYIWWIDSRDAIAAMMNTIYPGQRAAITGGGLPSWFMVKGLINPMSLFTENLINTNESESSSFIFLLFPLIALVLMHSLKTRRIHPVSVSILLFIVFALYYQYIGFPLPFTELTLWGRTTPNRVDLSLGLAQTMLLAYLIADRSNRLSNPPSKIGALLLAILLVTLAITVYLLMTLPIEWRRINGFYPTALVGICFLMLASYALCMERNILFISTMLIWTFGISLAFNPLSIAPNYLRADYFKGDTANRLIKNKRVLFLESQVPAMMLMAAGIPVLNGVFFYPQKTLWKALDPDNKQVSSHNRYHHLIFLPNNNQLGQNAFIRAPAADLVYVEINVSDFDFKVLPLDYVITGRQNESALTENRSLKFLEEIHGNLIFQVQRP